MKTSTILIVFCIFALVLCASAKKNKGAKNEVAQVKSEGGDECLICGYLVGKVEGYELHNLTEDQIIKNLESDCRSGFKGVVADLCLVVVNKYGVKIVKDVGDGIAPDQICKDIGLCSDNEVVINDEAKAKPFKPHDKKLKLNNKRC